MTIAEQAIKIIQARYDSPEYKAGIESIKVPEQKMYGEIDKIHTTAVLDWARKLWGKEAPEALEIAAAGHDWDRAFENERDLLEEYPAINAKPIPEWYDLHKAMHSANTARILRRELSDIVPKDMMLDVVYLVFHHEIGGIKNKGGTLQNLQDRATNTYNLNKAADILQQADSLAFFNILDIYVNWRKPQKIEQKIKYMIERIDDPKIIQYLKELNFKDPNAIEIYNKLVLNK